MERVGGEQCVNESRAAHDASQDLAGSPGLVLTRQVLAPGGEEQPLGNRQMGRQRAEGPWARDAVVLEGHQVVGELAARPSGERPGAAVEDE